MSKQSLHSLINNRRFYTENLPKPFDNSGEGDDPKTVVSDFLELIPEDKREEFESYKQSLIDKGVNIGNARQSKKAEEKAKIAVSEFLSSKGLSEDEIDELKSISSNKDFYKGILEKFQADTPEAVLAILEEAERAEMTEQEKLKDELEKALKKKAELETQLNLTKTSKTKKEEELEIANSSLFKNFEKILVGGRIKSIAKDLGAYDPEDLAERLSTQVLLEEVEGDFVPFVVDSKKNKRFDSEGNPVSLDVLVKEYLVSKPHLAKSTLLGGVGGKGSPETKQKGSSSFTAAQLNDPSFVAKNMAAIEDAIKKGLIKV